MLAAFIDGEGRRWKEKGEKSMEAASIDGEERRRKKEGEK